MVEWEGLSLIDVLKMDIIVFINSLHSVSILLGNEKCLVSNGNLNFSSWHDTEYLQNSECLDVISHNDAINSLDEHQLGLDLLVSEHSLWIEGASESLRSQQISSD